MLAGDAGEVDDDPRRVEAGRQRREGEPAADGEVAVMPSASAGGSPGGSRSPGS